MKSKVLKLASLALAVTPVFSVAAQAVSQQSSPFHVSVMMGFAQPNTMKSDAVNNFPKSPGDPYTPVISRLTMMSDIGLLYDLGKGAQIGLHFNGSLGQSIHGQMYRHGNAKEVYNFSTEVSRYTLMGTYQVSFGKAASRWQPYGLLGVGASFNRTADFAFAAQAGTSDPMDSPAYADHTNTAFAFEAGLGLQFRVTRDCNLVAQYNYLDAGDVFFGKGQHGSDAPRYGLHYNAIIFGVSYRL